MTILLGARPTAQPVPTGTGQQIVSPSSGSVGDRAWPATNDYFYNQASGGTAWQIGPVNRPQRFWLCCSALLIFHCTVANWTRADWRLDLATDPGVAQNDLLGNQYFQALMNFYADGGSYWSATMECRFFCEANFVYYVRCQSQGSAGAYYYYTHLVHHQMVGWTVGEGAV